MKWLLVVPRLVVGSDGCKVFPITLAGLSATLRAIGEEVAELDLHRIPGPASASLGAELRSYEHVAVVCVDLPEFEANVAAVFECAKTERARTVLCLPRDTVEPRPVTGSAIADFNLSGLDIKSVRRLVAELCGSDGGDEQSEPATRRRKAPTFMGLTALQTFAADDAHPMLPLVLLDEAADGLLGFADTSALNTYGREIAGDQSFESFLTAFGLDCDGLWQAAAEFLERWLSAPAGRRPLAILDARGAIPQGVTGLQVGVPGAKPATGDGRRAMVLRDMALSMAGCRPPGLPGAAIAAARWLVTNGVRQAAQDFAEAMLSATEEAADATAARQAMEALLRQSVAQQSDGAPDGRDRAVSDMLRGRFCPRPFASIGIDSNGGKSIGCEAHLRLPLEAVSQSSGLTFLNNPNLRRLRMSILLGTYDFCCRERCPMIVHDQLPDRDEARNPYIARHIREDPLQVGRMSEITLQRSIVAFEATVSSGLSLRIDLPDPPSTTGPVFASALSLLPAARSVTLRRARGVLNGEDGRALMDEIIEGSVHTATIESDGRDLTPDALGPYLDRGPNLQIVILVGVGAADVRFSGQYGDDDLLASNLDYLSRERRWERLKHLSVRFQYNADTFTDMPVVARHIDTYGWDGVVFRAAEGGLASGKDLHLPAHPLHQAFVEICCGDAMDDPRIDDDFARARVEALNLRRASDSDAIN